MPEGSAWEGERYDAVVVGAGPAGAAAARHLAHGGARVVLIEKLAPPRYKTCGGGLVGKALAELPAELAFEAERSFTRVELGFLESGLSFRVERPEPIVVMVMRAELDHALVRAAVAAGAEFQPDCAFEGLEERGGEVLVATRRGPLRAALVIAADGALSPVARAAGWRAAPACVPALEGELAVGPDGLTRFADHARFDFELPAGGYAWVFPKRAHLSVGVVQMHRGPARLKELLAQYLARLGLGAAGPLELHGFLIPLRPRPGGLARGRVLLAGDAAGLADPVTAEGISHALASGRLAAQAALEERAHPERAGAAYERALERTLLPELRAARFLARLVYRHPRLRNAVFRRRGAALCSGMCAVIAGRSTYRALLFDPRNYARLLANRPRA
jgi:geranylgeranyl reductase family protein